MDRTACSVLDDYLARALRDDDRARFISHLAACADCRRAADEQERLTALLRQATSGLDRVPAGLIDRVERRLRTARRRRTAAVSLAAAVMIAGIWPIAHRTGSDPPVKVPVSLS